MKQFIISFLMIVLSPIAGADLIVEVDETRTWVGGFKGQPEGSQSAFFEIDFSITSEEQDAEIRIGNNKNFSGNPGPGFLWEYRFDEVDSLWGDTLTSFISTNGNVSHTEEKGWHVVIQEGNTEEFTLSAVFSPVIGASNLKVAMTSGHETNGTQFLFPEGSETGWVYMSSVPEPSTFALILLGALLLRKR